MSDDQFESLKRKAADFFKYKDYEKGAAAEFIRSGDTFVNYYHAMNLFELNSRQLELEKLKAATRIAPSDIVSAASGQYLSRRQRTTEGYRRIPLHYRPCEQL